MKVYINYLPSDARTDAFQDIDFKGREKIMERFKDRVITILKPLEKEIDAEGGIIFLNEDGTIECKNFSEEMKQRIIDLFQPQ